MAGELKGVAIPGSIGYARVLSGRRVWNGAQFEGYASANIASYTVVMAELGSSGVFVADFPAGITSPGTYEYFFYLQDGGSPAESDRILSTGSVKWTGTALEDAGGTIAGAMSGPDWLAYVVRSFGRDDKAVSVFDLTQDAIAEIRRRLHLSDDEIEKTIEDNITVLGDYRMDLPEDFGRLVSDVIAKDGKTSWPLRKLSKAQYDQRYSGFGNLDAQKGQPVDYCLYADQIWIGPIPDRTAFTFSASYLTGADTSVDTDTVSVPYTNKGRREVLRNGVLYRLYKLVENDDQAAQYKSLWEEGLDQVETLARRNREPARFTAYRDF